MIDKSRRTALKTIGGTGILLTAGLGTATARKGKRKGASGDDTIVDVAKDSDFDVLVAAVEEAGLVDTLSGNRQLTVFAPTDQAFKDLASALGVEPADLLERDDLADILTYHVTSGRRYSESVLNAPEIKMLNGETVDVDGTTLNGGGLGGAEIDDTDIEAGNGVVHVIDGVLLP